MIDGIVLHETLGKGTFSKVVRARADVLGKVDFAIKMEPSEEERKKKKAPTQLRYEYKILRLLKGIPGVPAVYKFWDLENGAYWMGMELLGKDLEHEMRYGNMSVEKIVNEIAPAYINILKSVHDKGILHRDIKPQNMVIGNNSSGYRLVDFGLSKKYTIENGNHIPYRDGKRLTGTPRFASRHIHAGSESSRRDDLESLGYVFIYLCKNGKLPWMSKSITHCAQIAATKRSTSIISLCHGLPTSFRYYMENVKSLSFSEKPNYELLLSFFDEKM